VKRQSGLKTAGRGSRFENWGCHRSKKFNRCSTGV